MTQFFQYVLRTTDVAAARAFYTAVLGSGDLSIVELHEQAIARGARPHWLGFLGVDPLDEASSAFQARGATPLGPKVQNPQGLTWATVRDPGGAVVALAESAAAPARSPDVVWHVLNTLDVERAKANYRELFGWQFEAPIDLPDHGVFHPFAWQPGGALVGALCDIAERPTVHPHWLFHFRVRSLAAALETVHERGGSVIGPFTLPGRTRIAVCDDAQGAAFSLLEAPLADSSDDVRG